MYNANNWNGKCFLHQSIAKLQAVLHATTSAFNGNCLRTQPFQIRKIAPPLHFLVHTGNAYYHQYNKCFLLGNCLIISLATVNPQLPNLAHLLLNVYDIQTFTSSLFNHLALIICIILRKFKYHITPSYF